MDLGWGLIVKNRSEMNVKICSVTFKLIHVCCFMCQILCRKFGAK